MILYDPFHVVQTKYLFLTGKGGVGKTSVACATAVALVDAGKKVLLISTDPASNLQDVFSMELTNKATPIAAVPNLAVANLDPVQAAAEYRESVIGPYRGLLPEAALRNMEEQLSGSCTVEIAAFNEFTNFLTDEAVACGYDHIIFDTAPTNTPCACCNCRRRGASSSRRANTARPVWASCRAWNRGKNCINRPSRPWPTGTRRRCSSSPVPMPCR